MRSEQERVTRHLEVLQESWTGCTKCQIHEMRQGPDIFFGLGNPTPDYLLVLQSPSESDEASGDVLEGAEGALLLELLSIAGIEVSDCFITYAVSCRPKLFIPATEDSKERIETRKPVKEELTACRPRLNEIIYRTDPKLIITVGEEALKTVVRGRQGKFLDSIGKQQVCILFAAGQEVMKEGSVEGASRYLNVKYPVLPLPEMTAIMSNPSTANHGPYYTALRALSRAHEYMRFLKKNEDKETK